MKRLLAVVFVLVFICAPCIAEESETATGGENSIYDLYEYDGETYELDIPFDVSFANAFTLTMPAGWSYFDVSEQQSANGIFACFGDGTYFMFVKSEPDVGAYEDISEYALSLTMNSNFASIFTTTFNGYDFVCYTDYDFYSSDCAAYIPGVGIFTFYFYPSDGNTEFARTVMDIMDTFAILEAE